METESSHEITVCITNVDVTNTEKSVRRETI